MTALLAWLKPPCCLSAGAEGTPASLVAGINSATLVMLAVPALIVATVTVWLVRSARAAPLGPGSSQG